MSIIRCYHCERLVDTDFEPSYKSREYPEEDVCEDCYDDGTDVNEVGKNVK